MITQAELDQRLAWVEECMTSERAISRLTGKDWGEGPGGRALCAADAYGEPRNIDEVEVMVDAVLAASGRDEMIRSACHDILHQIGVAAWNVGGEESLELGYVLCGMGYIHGLMSQALVGEGDRRTTVTKLVKFCKKLSINEIGNADDAITDGCAHGIGHAIGSTIEDLEQGNDLCQNVIVHRGDMDKRLCFSGALNQYILDNPAQTNDPAGEVVGCTRFTGAVRSDCYMLTLFYLKTKAPEVRAFCLTQAGGDERNGCWRSVGMIASREDLFAGSGTPGYELVQTPDQFARYINDVCLGDVTTSCVSQLISEASEKVLNPPLLARTCEFLARWREGEECKRVIVARRNIHLLS